MGMRRAGQVQLAWPFVYGDQGKVKKFGADNEIFSLAATLAIAPFSCSKCLRVDELHKKGHRG
jgi:hypothetical protein